MAGRPHLEEAQLLPCGCIMGTGVIEGVKAFVMEPCSTGCEIYQYALSQAAEQGKPVEFREVDD